MKKIFFILALFVWTGAAHAAEYVVDPAASTISFSGTHAGKPFSGVFKTWSTDIVFDEKNLETSHIRAVFDLASATTGNAMFDGTLPQADWFDVKAYPEGVFESTSVTHKDGDVYHADGTLTLRGVTKPLGFDFTLSDLTATPATVQASFPIDRLAYDIGKQSDAKAEWVGQEIKVEVALSARVK